MAETIHYNIAVPETYEKDWKEKTVWTTVGTAFANDSGSISLNLPKNITVSGRVVLFLFPKDGRTGEADAG